MISEKADRREMSPIPPVQMTSFAEKRNEKRIIIKQRTFEDIPTIDERKEALLRSQIAKKQPMAPMARKTLTPPFLSERGKFSLGFRHPVVLRGQSSNAVAPTSNEIPEGKISEKKVGRRQFGNLANHSICSSAKAALQNYSQDLTYGTITVTALQALKDR
ncbi:hypothetical protein X975_15151, partial [Stegodyphus mimosarum]